MTVLEIIADAVLLIKIKAEMSVDANIIVSRLW